MPSGIHRWDRDIGCANLQAGCPCDLSAGSQDHSIDDLDASTVPNDVRLDGERMIDGDLAEEVDRQTNDLHRNHRWDVLDRTTEETDRRPTVLRLVRPEAPGEPRWMEDVAVLDEECVRHGGKVVDR